MTVEVVVTEPADDEGSVPVAVAEAVTPGELSARLELLESRMNERVDYVSGAAFDAQLTAEQAQETAEVAAIVASVAAEQSADEVPGAESEDGGETQEEVEQASTEEGVRPPERRNDKPENHADGDSGEVKPRVRSYGAGWLSGGR